MSNVRGRIAVDVQFADSTTSAGVQSLKTITLQDATEYTTGKVAIATGTVGTVATQIDYSATGYVDAAGNPVVFTDVNRAAMRTSSVCLAFETGGDLAGIVLNPGSVSIVDVGGGDGIVLRVVGTPVTASYTIVMYGT
jgi:hypothetical protein